MPHPYKQFAERNFWARAVSDTPWQNVFDQERGKFEVQASDLIATAGSCFAQRIATHLRTKGFSRTIFERAHPLVTAERASALGYDTFSARYGNVYTTRQLRQLVDEAFGLRPPIFDFAPARSGQILDLMRPTVNDGGFGSAVEAQADRLYHLGQVREMLVQADVFIFTLGLTETWSSPDGSVVYGTHPNVATGLDSRQGCLPLSLDYQEVYNDLVYVINGLRQHNPRLKFIFTVSPVALAATHQDKHVLSATSYSKSVLRAVAGRIADSAPYVDYFMSFELFNCAQSFGQFLSSDLRDVSKRGVGIAMQLFETLYLPRTEPVPSGSPDTLAHTRAPPASSALPSAPVAFADVECEEMLNAVFGHTP